MASFRPRKSLLGALALVAALAALVVIRFNPTGSQIITAGPLVLKLGTALAIGATGLALLALIASGASRRTSTGLPLFALLVCALAFVMIWKPDYFKPLPHRPAVKPASTAKQPPAVKLPEATPAVQQVTHEHRSKLFDLDSPPDAPAQGKPDQNVQQPRASAADPAHPVPAANPDPAMAVRAARSKLDAARQDVANRLASTPAFQEAREQADVAEARLKKARTVYAPGSSELITVSRESLAAHDKVESMISEAALRDPAYLDAARGLKTAESAK